MPFVSFLTASLGAGNQSEALRHGRAPEKLAICTEPHRSERQSGRTHDLVGPHPRGDRIEAGRLWWILGKRDRAPAADAAAECTQAVDGGLAVPGKPAALALGGRLRLLAQCAFNVPSRCSSAFEVFWSAGSSLLWVLPAV